METCKECGREFKNVGAHMRWAHPVRNSSSVSPAPKQESAPSPNHRFVSPHAKGLVVVMKPARVGYEPGPNGTQVSVQLPGKKVVFIMGEYSTSDQDIIDYFNHAGKYSGEGSGYLDRRYPVLDMTAKLGDRT